MLNSARNAPGVTRVNVVRFTTDVQTEMPGNEIPGLFVGMRVTGQKAVLLKTNLDHEGLFAMRNCFLGDAGKGITVTGEILLAEHNGLLSMKKISEGLTILDFTGLYKRNLGIPVFRTGDSSVAP
jgi:hypothetical protein